MWVNHFPMNDVDDLFYDSRLNRILVSSRLSDQVFAIDVKTIEWKFAQAGYRINRVRAVGDKLLAASLFDGVLIEPQSEEATPEPK